MKSAPDDGVVVVRLDDGVLEGLKMIQGLPLDVRAQELITDLSSLDDFAGVDEMELTDILAKIRDVYGLDIADLASGNMLEIFRRLHEHQSSQRPRPAPH